MEQLRETLNEAAYDQPTISSTIQQDSPIWNAKVDALECVFEYLNLNDICAIGKTCKKLHLIAGNYFNCNYPSQNLIIRACRDEIIQTMNNFFTYNSTTNFGPFTQRLEVYIDSGNELPYVAKNVNKKLKAIVFCMGRCRNLNLECIKDILKSVEYIELKYKISTMSPPNLKFCENLKYLSLNVYNFNLIYNHHYPTLETLEVNFDFEKSSFEVITFLKMNPQIKRLSMKELDTDLMLHIIKEAEPKLDMLSIYMYEGEVVEISERLNPYHELGYFKRFSFSGNFSSFLSDIRKVPSLSGLFISHYRERESKIDEISHGLCEMVKLVDLNISYITYKEADILSKCLVNIEEINLFNGSLQLLSLFARRLPKLKLASCSKTIEYYEDNDINVSLKEINDERAKLPNAHKLIIYVGDDMVFQRLRWKFIDLNFNYLEIRSMLRFCHYE
ncbi:uncharacterized protein LOC116345006 [Contarinia nasturtii]|uniref:uncharacterized protein LOC116345006 n=1 Tax=Contarinia nasturtii TaxID=265458 RepID=UPI0012D3D416|nr:uncharacterized protein LOC116345006 [Contarinia nasturtii]